MSILGTAFRKGLNAVTSSNAYKSWASPTNTGVAKFINGTQQISGNTHIFQFGLKHKIVALGYKESMKKYIQMAHGNTATGAELAAVKDKIPKMFHQALNELTEWTAMGGNIPL